MNKNENKIKLLLTSYGSLDVVSIPLKIYKDSHNVCDIECLVPFMEDINSDILKVYASSFLNGERIWTSNTYNLPYLKMITKDNKKYKVFSGSFPNEFCSSEDDINISFAYVTLNNDNTASEILPTAELNLHFSGSGYNENGVTLADNDVTVARVNLLSNVSLIRVDIAKELPLNAEFNLNGYKTPLYAYFTSNNTEAPLEYNMPITKAKKETKQCILVPCEIVRDTETPDLIGYQSEFAYFDKGICKRTNKYNISQASINQYSLLELGEWEIANQAYINEINNQSDANLTDIAELKRLINAGSTYIGEYQSKETLPTDEELNAFVLDKAGRATKMGDIVTFVQKVEDGTDIVYNIKYSDATKIWTSTPIPNIESASNKNLGLIKGTKDSYKTFAVDINNGEILDILHKNEEDVAESIHNQVNRNSTLSKSNKAEIDKSATNISNEIARAKEAELANTELISNEQTRATLEEEKLKSSIEAETTRATSAEQTNATAIESEVTRAKTEEIRLDEAKLEKSSIDEEYIKNVTFSLNGDTNVATVDIKNPKTGVSREFELSIIGAASPEISGLMTSEMVQSLNKALQDIETMKYIGRQIQSFPTYADALLFDFSTITDIELNDYFIVGADESRTEPSEHGKTTKYNCINTTLPLTIDSFRFQSAVATVVIQVATESSMGGVLSTNANGYIYVESTGAMKLVGYDAIITSIANLTQALTDEISRAKEAEKVNADAIAAEVARATEAESKKLDKLTNEYVKEFEVPGGGSGGAAEIYKLCQVNITKANCHVIMEGTVSLYSNIDAKGWFNPFILNVDIIDKDRYFHNDIVRFLNYSGIRTRLNYGVLEIYGTFYRGDYVKYKLTINNGTASNFFEKVESYPSNCRIPYDITNELFAFKNQLPTKTSELTNDSNFATTSQLPTKTSQLANDSNFATVSQIPTKTSEITNDSDYVSSSQLPTKTSQLTNDSNFVELSNGLIPKTYLPNVLSCDYIKELSIGAEGFVLIGKFSVYDTNITVDISSTTGRTYNSRLIIACQNNTIQEAMTYGDARNSVTPNIFIKPSSSSDAIVEIYFKPEAWSKNIIHIMGNQVNAITNVIETVTSIPSTATLKPINSLYNNLMTTETQQTITSRKTFNDVIFAYRYTTNNNAPAIVMDKPSDGYFGIGANGSTQTIRYGAANTDFTWKGVDNSYTHSFDGTIRADKVFGAVFN